MNPTTTYCCAPASTGPAPLAAAKNTITIDKPPLYRTAAARDAAARAVPDLASVKAVWAALHALERAALPLAEAELRLVAAATARSRAAGRDDPALSPFLSASLPAMPLPRYALHVTKATGYGHEGLAVGLALMARYAVASGRGVTPLSMHRLFATCMQLGMKTASDKFVKNVYVAPLLGMTLAELNTLEVDLARALDFGTLVTAAELTRLPEALAALPKSATMEDVQRIFDDRGASHAALTAANINVLVSLGGLVEMYATRVNDVVEEEAETASPSDTDRRAGAGSTSCFACTLGARSSIAGTTAAAAAA